MFCAEKNSYLQLVCAMEPRVINKAVERALGKKVIASPSANENISPIKCKCAAFLKTDKTVPSAKFHPVGPTSAQPSTYAPQVDVTRARVGFGRVGLKLLVRDLHSPDHLVQLQAIHSVLDQVRISENALFLMNLDLVHRLTDLLDNRDPAIREKVCLILTHLAGYHQGRKRQNDCPGLYFRYYIISENALFLMNLDLVHRLTDLLDNRDPAIREKVCLILTHLAGYHQGRKRQNDCPGLYFRLMWICMRDKKEIRYAAAYTLRTLCRDHCACEAICKVDGLVENLLKVITNEYAGIVLIHLKSFKNLFEYDPIVPLKANAFQIMLHLFTSSDPRVISEAMECTAQLCKHDVGKLLADEYDLTFFLRPYLTCKDVDVIISAAGLMCYTTLTKRSKWRAKEATMDLTRNLLHICHTPNNPVLQLRAIQVLINLCDCPDIRQHVRGYWKRKLQAVAIRTHEEWDGTTETSSMGIETGHNYRTMCIEGMETIKNDYGDNAKVVNVHSYLRRLQEKKCQLLEAIDWKPYS